LNDGWSHTATVEQWRKRPLNLPDKVPAVFSWLAS